MMTTPQDASTLIKPFFGRPARVLVAAWILGRKGTPFYQSEAQDALSSWGEARSSTRDALELFGFFGMLRPDGVGRRRYYTQLENPMWNAYEAIGVATGLLTPSRPRLDGT